MNFILIPQLYLSTPKVDGSSTYPKGLMSVPLKPYRLLLRYGCIVGCKFSLSYISMYIISHELFWSTNTRRTSWPSIPTLMRMSMWWFGMPWGLSLANMFLGNEFFRGFRFGRKQQLSPRGDRFMLVTRDCIISYFLLMGCKYIGKLSQVGHNYPFLYATMKVSAPD